ncbi:D-Tyr tRNAtyr deacylase-like domain-containing protein [Desarmillaria tabescens]|uniref:D-aminoacyl-tRNA deacylase n=1 Tax=Armillaria tabescens TaxID=1929756 RepID=A0AA39NDR0_ARMTA|nr:D-Tyr tRNAtyr deacylase-like domain-containing protein [Desarmillaria tabescens]KAK0463598.1 D-Tyr tRNAtyr deacylase-like domain-containing protein [Desarmillaria tabescens]
MVLVGIGSDDTASDVSSTIKKILSLRVFSDPTDPKKMWKASVKDIEGEILCVSQFTLLANTTKDKPDFHLAMSADPARELYGTFLDMLREAYVPERVKDGKFGAMMNVSLTNDGPVTFTVDSRKYQYVGDAGGNGIGNANARGAKSKKGPAPSTPAETL